MTGGKHMRLKPIPESEYKRRIVKLQKVLKAEEIDVFVGYSSECESATSRYLSGFWPFFDFSSVIVPKDGKAVLITGGPESLEFARVFSKIPTIKVNPLLVETSPPEWVPQVSGESFSDIIPEVCGGIPQRVGVANYNIFPHVLFEDLRKAAPKAEIIPADDLLLRVQSVKRG